MTGTVGDDIAAEATRLLLREAVALGGDREAMLREAQLEARMVEVRDGRLPLSAQYRLWQAAVRQTQNADLPFRVARAYEASTFDVLGFACMTCATLGDALDRLVRYMALWVEGERYTLARSRPSPTGGRASIVLEQALERSDGMRYAAESALAKILLGIRQMTDVEVAPIEVRFAHGRPTDSRPHESFFGCPIRFDAPRHELILDDKTLELPLVKADPGLAAFFDRHARSLLAVRSPSTPVLERVRRAISESLAAGDASLDAVARRVGWSGRTLRRRLTEEQTSFREVFDEARRELAESYLLDPEVGIGEVAFLLGYSDASSFHRAFKRWTGCTPDEFRRG